MAAGLSAHAIRFLSATLAAISEQAGDEWRPALGYRDDRNL
ncbi:hypothetical protein [Parasphingorhabdus flavimaris]|nr:hypothetical protein [Parasphingorhabdus flavimaris]